MPILTPLAVRVASSALKHYGHKPVFQLAIEDPSDCEEIARTLERMGCAVRQSQVQDMLTVAPPNPVE